MKMLFWKSYAKSSSSLSSSSWNRADSTHSQNLLMITTEIAWLFLFKLAHHNKRLRDGYFKSSISFSRALYLWYNILFN